MELLLVNIKGFFWFYVFIFSHFNPIQNNHPLMRYPVCKCQNLYHSTQHINQKWVNLVSFSNLNDHDNWQKHLHWNTPQTMFSTKNQPKVLILFWPLPVHTPCHPKMFWPLFFGLCLVPPLPFSMSLIILVTALLLFPLQWIIHKPPSLSRNFLAKLGQVHSVDGASYIVWNIKHVRKYPNIRLNTEIHHW